MASTDLLATGSLRTNFLNQLTVKTTKTDILNNSRNSRFHSVRANAPSQISDESVSRVPRVVRRELILGASVGISSILCGNWGSAVALPAQPVQVGTFLPKSENGEFVRFTPGPKDTPALRAGNVTPYSFDIPPSWAKSRIANILSGNYCQPKCAEPWIEVKFESPKEGTILVVAAPMVRLTNKPNATIEEIGAPGKIIAALGPFVTGDSYDPDEVVETKIRTVDGQTYYDYTLETPYARSGTHNLACATAKGNTVLLFVVNATDKQWASGEGTLRKLALSFAV